MKKLLLLLFVSLIFGCSNKKSEDIGDLDIHIYETYEYCDLFQKLEEINIFLKKEGNGNIKETELTYEEWVKENPFYAVLYPNINPQTGRLNCGPIVGVCPVKDTAILNGYLKDDEIKKFLPKDVKFTYTLPYDPDSNFVQVIALKLRKLENNISNGYSIKEISLDSLVYGYPKITILMDEKGAKKWKKFTYENIEKSIAIVLDGYAYSFPPVVSEIENGIVHITGKFTFTNAEDIIKRINGKKVYFF